MIEVLEAETDFSLDTEGIIDLIGVDEAEQDVAWLVRRRMKCDFSMYFFIFGGHNKSPVNFISYPLSFSHSEFV